MESPTNAPERPDRAAILRYIAFQIPGLLATSALAVAGVYWFDWSPVWAATAVAVWAFKDVVMFPWMWRAYAPRESDENDLVGRTGVVEDAVSPKGRVRVGSERWRAVLADGERALETGAPIRIVGIEGLVVAVVRHTPDPDSSPIADAIRAERNADT